MIVVSYADFFSNPAFYKEKAEKSAIKVLPQKKKRKFHAQFRKNLMPLTLQSESCLLTSTKKWLEMRDLPVNEIVA